VVDQGRGERGPFSEGVLVLLEHLGIIYQGRTGSSVIVSPDRAGAEAVHTSEGVYCTRGTHGGLAIEGLYTIIIGAHKAAIRHKGRGA